MQQRMKELNCVDVTPPDSPVTDDHPVKSKRFLAKPESLDSLAYSDSELSWKNVYTDANSNNTKVREEKTDIDCVRNESCNLSRRFPNFLIRGWFCRQRESQTRPTTGLGGGDRYESITNWNAFKPHVFAQVRYSYGISQSPFVSVFTISIVSARNFCYSPRLPKERIHRVINISSLKPVNYCKNQKSFNIRSMVRGYFSV